MIQELNPMQFMFRLCFPIHIIPTSSELQANARLSPFITGHDSRTLFAIGLTAKQIFQAQVSASSNEEWVPVASN